MKSHKQRNTYWQDVAQDKKVQPKPLLKFAAWNIRTMLDSEQCNRPERRSAIISRELRKYDIDVAALSEVRFPDSGSIREEGGYTIFWSGRPSGTKREAGVALAISNALTSKLVQDPKPMSDRLMTLRLPLTNERNCTVIATYAPTMTNGQETIDSFYSQLYQVLRAVPNSDKIILLGDFNARVGQDHMTWPKVLGKFGTGKLNSNGELLISLCSEFQLAITNTFFKHKAAHKHSWMHPCSRHWDLIDLIITRQRDIEDFLDTRAMRGANCSTDHIMIWASTRMAIRRRTKKGRQPTAKLDVGKLKQKSVREDLESAYSSKLDQPFNGSSVECWDAFKAVVYDTAKEHLGNVKRKHEDWFDKNEEELGKIIEARNHARDKVMNVNTRSAKAKLRKHKTLLQKRCRELKNEWWSDKAAELQQLADMNDPKGFYKSMRAVWGPRVNHPDQLTRW